MSFLDALERIVGAGNVLSRPDELMVYECDAFTLQRRAPGTVVLPSTTEQVAAVMRLCREHQVPVIPRGAGTSLSGSVLAVDGGVMLGLSRMNRVLSVDALNRRALVESGCVNAWVTRAAEPYGLFYAPDPSSQSACTIGGNVATNSGGPHTLKYGVTTNHVLGMEIVLADGQTHWIGAEPDGGEDVAGLDLRGAVIGSEGMFGVVTRVLLRLIPAPQAFRTMLAVFDTVDDASRAVSAIIASGIVPGALEMMDGTITAALEEAFSFGFPLDAGALLIVELDGLEAGIDAAAAAVIAICQGANVREVRRATSEAERAELWRCRKRAFGAVGRLGRNFMTHDGVVPRSRLPEIMHFIDELAERYGMMIPNVFHAGDGNIHPLVVFDERDPDSVRNAIAAGDEILQKCIDLGGSVTGEHGIGVEKIDLMSRQFTAMDLDAMWRLRRAFDPELRMNPHKMFPGSKRCGEFISRKQIVA